MEAFPAALESKDQSVMISDVGSHLGKISRMVDTNVMDLKELDKERPLSVDRGGEDKENLASTFNMSIISKKPEEVTVGPPGKVAAKPA